MADELIGYKAYLKQGGMKVLLVICFVIVCELISQLFVENLEMTSHQNRKLPPPPYFKIWTGSLPDQAPGEGGTASFQQPPTTLPAKHCFSF